MILEILLVFSVFVGAILLVRHLLQRRSEHLSNEKNQSEQRGPKTDSSLGFYLKGNQLGFRVSELRALMRLSRQFGIADPSNMLLSGKTFDRCLRQILVKGNATGLMDDPQTVGLLFRALEYRMGVERNRPRHRTGMETTRTLAAGQLMKLLLPGIGLFQTRIVENSRTHIAVEMPVGKGLPSNHQWRNQHVEVYFWRRGDAMYYFSSTVLNSPEKTALNPVLHLNHAEELMRTQKRANIRVEVLKEGRVMPLSEAIPADERWLPDHGYLCKVTDISETGAAIIVRGKVKPGRSVKIQIELGGLPIVMCGDIKSSTLNVTHNASLLHVEANPRLSTAMRVRVMAYVLGLVTDNAPAEVATEVAAPDIVVPDVQAESTGAPPIDGSQELSGEDSLVPVKPALPPRTDLDNLFEENI